MGLGGSEKPIQCKIDIRNSDSLLEARFTILK